MVGFRNPDKFRASLKRLSDHLGSNEKLRVGFLENSTYPDGTPTAMVAATNNFGGGHVPPRPFFSRAIAAGEQKWPKAMGAILKSNGYDVDKTLRLSGEMIKGEIQQSIRDTNDPPLAASTIAAKGFDKPLIDTGHMINSVDYEVK